MLAIQAMGAVRSFCFHRLLLLEQKFNLHVMMNADKEFLAQKSAPHRDFYNVRKVCLWAWRLFSLFRTRSASSRPRIHASPPVRTPCGCQLADKADPS